MKILCIKDSIGFNKGEEYETIGEHTVRNSIGNLCCFRYFPEYFTEVTIDTTMNKLDEKVYKEIARTYEIYQGPDSAPICDVDTIYLSDVLSYARSKRVSIEHGSDMFKGVIREWNLSKPGYEEQTEECKNFIRNMILL